MFEKDYLLMDFNATYGNGNYVLQEAIEDYACNYEVYLGTFIEDYLINEKGFEKEKALNTSSKLEETFLNDKGYIEISNAEIIAYVNAELKKGIDL